MRLILSFRGAQAVYELIPLSQLQRGTSGHVSELVGGSERRLEELGLRRGETVEMIDPGSPCIVRVLGSKLCFRASQLLGVLVRPGATA
ncbi:MAG: ferrous iron transport protein A [Planctomycetia bacterium]|nr:ferrous iron transport protein A [Planctomycetia bacterium]